MSEWDKAIAQATERIIVIRDTPRSDLPAIPCPRCHHALSSHDPEDGTCDSHDGLSPCRCGRTCGRRKLGDESPNIGFPMVCSEPALHDGPDRFEPFPERIAAIVRMRGSRGLMELRREDIVEAFEEIERRLLRSEGAYEL